jgi:glycogen phosphorylase
LHNKHRKVQFVIAGKAHPMDIPGKELIRDINHFIREQGLGRQIAFIPDYDLHVARLMVAGCDIWLNTPRRPREASGTSGMKAAMNGLLNLSVLDGWWDEADYVRTGWPIGHGEDYQDLNYQDNVEANALYELLEQEVVPLFYNRDAEGIPRHWVQKMKEAIPILIQRGWCGNMPRGGIFQQAIAFSISKAKTSPPRKNWRIGKLNFWKIGTTLKSKKSMCLHLPKS